MTMELQCAGVVLLSPGATHVAVVQQARTAPDGTPVGFYAFPKGKREPGDASLLDTAVRELEEETGVRAQEVWVREDHYIDEVYRGGIHSRLYLGVYQGQAGTWSGEQDQYDALKDIFTKGLPQLQPRLGDNVLFASWMPIGALLSMPVTRPTPLFPHADAQHLLTMGDGVHAVLTFAKARKHTLLTALRMWTDLFMERKPCTSFQTAQDFCDTYESDTTVSEPAAPMVAPHAESASDDSCPLPPFETAAGPTTSDAAENAVRPLQATLWDLHRGLMRTEITSDDAEHNCPGQASFQALLRDLETLVSQRKRPHEAMDAVSEHLMPLHVFQSCILPDARPDNVQRKKVLSAMFSILRDTFSSGSVLRRCIRLAIQQNDVVAAVALLTSSAVQLTRTTAWTYVWKPLSYLTEQLANDTSPIRHWIQAIVHTAHLPPSKAVLQRLQTDNYVLHKLLLQTPRPQSSPSAEQGPLA